MSQIQSVQEKALRIREHILNIATGPEGTHVGGSLSIADILAVLYFQALRICPAEPRWSQRDYFVLSKGHCSAALYATLAECSFFPVAELTTYGRSGGRLNGHPTTKVPGVEFPTGSLGHGLALGTGLALAAQRDGRANKAFVLLGDGELQEGSVWEAAMAAAQFGLDNLVAIIDRNGLQINGQTEHCMHLEPLADRWRSFGWGVAEIDGHNISDLVDVFTHVPLQPGCPSVIIAHTIKGKGIKFLEDHKKSHYATSTPALFQKAWIELHETEKKI
jgi:transketolase